MIVSTIFYQFKKYIPNKINFFTKTVGHFQYISFLLIIELCYTLYKRLLTSNTWHNFLVVYFECNVYSGHSNLNLLFLQKLFCVIILVL